MRLHGARLLDAGFHIIPIAPGKKLPGQYSAGRWEPMPAWSRFSHHKPSEHNVNMWADWPGSGVGIVTGGASGVIGVDLDILDEKLAHSAKLVFFKHLGVTPLIRVGKAPKMMLVYRVGAPMSKIAMSPIEVLANGQQFVAYGVHPQTGLDYHWPVESPDDTTVESLPLVTEAQIRAACDEAYAMLPEELKPARLSPTEGTGVPGGTISSEISPATPEAVAGALEHIPNNDLQWDDWKRILMAVFVCSRGAEEAYFQFLKWSRQSAKHNDVATRREWNGCKVSVPNRINFGTLYHLATQNGWVPPADMHFNEEKQSRQVADVSAFEDWPMTGEPRVASERELGRTTVAQIIDLHPEQRIDVLKSVGLDASMSVDPVTGEIIETLFPTRDTHGLSVDEFKDVALNIVVEEKGVNLLEDFEPTKLHLTQHEITGGTLPARLTGKFPQEWLYTSSLIGRIAHWVDSCSLYEHRLFSLMAAFTMFGSIVGRQYRTRSGLRPNLNVCIIGPTGCGKEASRSAVTKLITAVGIANKIGPRGGFSSGSGVVEVLQNQPSLWLAIDEFGKKIAAYSGKGDQNQREMIAMFLEAIANDYIGGKGYANSADHPTRNVQFPNLNIFGSSQMEEITSALSSAASADGFIQRFLFVPTFANYVPMRRDHEPPEVPPVIVDELKFIVSQLQSLGGEVAFNEAADQEPNMMIVEMTREAQDFMYRLDDRKLGLLASGRNMWVRSVAQTIKIAMLEAIATNPGDPLITVELMNSARRLVDWFTNYAESYVVILVADNDRERMFNKLKSTIVDGGDKGVSRRDLTRKMQKLKSGDREDLLKSLVDCGDVELRKSPPGGRGAPGEMYHWVAP